MNYTAEELRQIADAVEAEKKGQSVEWRWSDEEQWKPTSSGMSGVCELADGKTRRLYRPKPQPKRVPWSKPEHVPGPVCWLRSVEVPMQAMVVSVSEKGFDIYSGSVARFVSWEHFSGIAGKHGYEYSTDRKTWHPCETEEPA